VALDQVHGTIQLRDPYALLPLCGSTTMQIPTFPKLENGELEVLTSVIAEWCKTKHIDPECECARAVTAVAIELMEAGFTTRENLSIALANALQPEV